MEFYSVFIYQASLHKRACDTWTTEEQQILARQFRPLLPQYGGAAARSVHFRQ